MLQFDALRFLMLFMRERSRSSIISLRSLNKSSKLIVQLNRLIRLRERIRSGYEDKQIFQFARTSLSALRGSKVAGLLIFIANSRSSKTVEKCKENIRQVSWSSVR